MKRIITVIGMLALVFSLTACGGEQQASEEESITGKVTEIDGTKVTLQLGELTEEARGGRGKEGKPDGEAPADSSGKPDGTPPADSSGKPDGTPPADFSGKPDGTLPEKAGGAGFEAGEESRTIDLADAAIQLEQGPDMQEGSLEDISVDSILVISMKGNEVQSVTVKAAGKMSGGKRGGAPSEAEQGAEDATASEAPEATE